MTDKLEELLKLVSEREKGLNEDSSALLIREASLALGNEEYDMAVNLATRALELDPENIDAYSIRVSAYSSRGDDELSKKDLITAMCITYPDISYEIELLVGILDQGDELRVLNDTIKEREDEIRVLKSQVSDYETSLEEEKGRNESSSKKLDETSRDVKGLRKAYDKAIEELRVAEDQLRSLRQDYTKLGGLYEKANSDLKVANERLSLLTDNYGLIGKENRRLKLENRNLKRENQGYIRGNLGLEKRIEAQEKEIRQLTNRLRLDRRNSLKGIGTFIGISTIIAGLLYGFYLYSFSFRKELCDEIPSRLTCDNVVSEYFDEDSSRYDIAQGARLQNRLCGQEEIGHFCNQIGEMARNGFLPYQTSPDQGEVNQFIYSNFATACELEDDDGCFNLAQSLEYGRGVEINNQEATRIYRRACDLGSDYACQRLETGGNNN